MRAPARAGIILTMRHRFAARAPSAVPARPVPGGGAAAFGLQRAIGNRATAQVLQRFQVEGPWSKNAPVHEVLTLMAIRTARERIAKDRLGPLLKAVNAGTLPDWGSATAHNIAPEKLDPSLQQYVRGVVWADDPKSWLFDEAAGTGNYSSGLKWYDEFDPSEKDDPAALIARSHYGDLQFLHAMASADAEHPLATRAKVLEWARFLVRVAKGEIAGSAKLRDVPITARLFASYADRTINELWNYGSASETEIRQRAAGTLFHLIQDSYAGGHVGRDRAFKITQFHAYEGQDHAKHDHRDQWAEGENLAERVLRTPGASPAIQRCAAVLVLSLIHI